MMAVFNGGSEERADEIMREAKRGMTDAEIKKALECCINAENCCECVYTKMCDGTTIHRFALDLINRQQAEIERLQEENKNLRAYVNGNGWGFISFLEYIKTTKAEAITYAMEWLQANHYINHSPERRKQLVKEMVGDAE